MCQVLSKSISVQAHPVHEHVVIPHWRPANAARRVSVCAQAGLTGQLAGQAGHCCWLLCLFYPFSPSPILTLHPKFSTI